MITSLRSSHPIRLAGGRARLVLAPLLLAPLLLAAACATSGSHAPSTPAAASSTPAATTPATTARATGAPSVAPSAMPTARPTPPQPTPVESIAPTDRPLPGADVIDTDWGTAWDRIPAGFPLPADARVAGPSDPTQGPASAIYVTGQTPDAVVALVQAGVGALGFSVEGIAGAEDGSVAVTLTGRPDACRAQVSVRPLGSLRFITVYYGAGCAKP